MQIPSLSLNIYVLVPLKNLVCLLTSSSSFLLVFYNNCIVGIVWLSVFYFLICILIFFSCIGRRKPQLILLDHGLYKELDFQTRTNYASLWKALVFADANAIKEYSTKLGAGEDLYALFAGVLTMRPWDRVVDPSMDHLVIQGNESDRLELQVRYSLSKNFPQVHVQFLILLVNPDSWVLQFKHLFYGIVQLQHSSLFTKY